MFISIFMKLKWLPCGWSQCGGRYIQAPANTTLNSLVPCVDLAAAGTAFTLAREVIYNGIETVRNCLPFNFWWTSSRMLKFKFWWCYWALWFWWHLNMQVTNVYWNQCQNWRERHCRRWRWKAAEAPSNTSIPWSIYTRMEASIGNPEDCFRIQQSRADLFLSLVTSFALRHTQDLLPSLKRYGGVNLFT